VLAEVNPSHAARIAVPGIIIGAVIAALVVAIGLAAYAFVERNTAGRNAHESKARELAVLAKDSLSDDPERSILLGMHAANATLQYGQPPVATAEDLLHQALLASQLRLTLSGHKDKVWSVAWSPDGKRLATASSDNMAKVWDAASGQELLTLTGQVGPVWSLAWSPDGKRLATGSGNEEGTEAVRICPDEKMKKARKRS